MPSIPEMQRKKLGPATQNPDHDPDHLLFRWSIQYPFGPKLRKDNHFRKKDRLRRCMASGHLQKLIIGRHGCNMAGPRSWHTHGKAFEQSMGCFWGFLKFLHHILLQSRLFSPDVGQNALAGK